MKRTKKVFAACVLAAAVLPCAVAAVACSSGSTVEDQYGNVISIPQVMREGEYSFSWAALTGVTGYVVRVGDKISSVGGQAYEAPALNGTVKRYGYSVDASKLEPGEYTVQFAAYIYDEKLGSTVGDWGEAFKITVGGLTDEYKVEKPAAPAVTRNGLTFRFTSNGLCTGYVMDLDGTVTGIGNGSTYKLDASSIGEGKHAVKFAAYKFDEALGTVIGEWSDTFEVDLFKVDEPVVSVVSAENSSSVTVFIAKDADSVSRLDFDFGDGVSATYTPIEKLTATTVLRFDDLTFTGKLKEGKLYTLKVRATNYYGVGESSMPVVFTYGEKEYEVQPPRATYLSADGGLTFSTLNNPTGTAFVLKVDDDEYPFIYTGTDFDYDSYSKSYTFGLGEILEAISAEDNFAITSYVYENGGAEFSLKILFEAGHDRQTDYSNVVRVDLGNEMFAEALANSVLEAVDGRLASALFEDQYTCAVISYRRIAYILRDKITVEVTFTDGNGVTRSLSGTPDEVYTYSDVYDFGAYLGYGAFFVRAVATYTTVKGETFTREILGKTIELERPEIYGVQIEGQYIVWDVTNSYTEGFEVEVLSTAGRVLKTYKCKSEEWDSCEFKDANEFGVKIYPVYKGERASASKIFNVKRGEVTEDVLRQNEEDIYILGLGDFPVKVSLVAYGNDGKELARTPVALSIKANYTRICAKTELYEVLNSVAFAGASGFAFAVQYEGNNYQYVDSLPKDYAIKLDAITYEQVDNQKIKFNREGLYIKNGSEDYEPIPEKYLDEKGNFDVVSYLDAMPAGTVKVGGESFNLTAGGSENLLLLPVTLNIQRATAARAEYDADRDYISFSNDSVAHHAEFDWYVVAEGSKEILYSGTTETGVDMGGLNLPVGDYDVCVRTRGNGTYMHGKYSSFAYAQYDIDEEDISFINDAKNGVTELKLPYARNLWVQVKGERADTGLFVQLFSGYAAYETDEETDERFCTVALRGFNYEFEGFSITAYSDTGFCRTAEYGVNLNDVFTHQVANKYGGYNYYYTTDGALPVSAAPSVVYNGMLYVRDSGEVIGPYFKLLSHGFAGAKEKTVTVICPSSSDIPIMLNDNVKYQSGSYYNEVDGLNSVRITLDYSDSVLAFLNKYFTLEEGYAYYTNEDHSVKLMSTATAGNISNYIYVFKVEK